MTRLRTLLLLNSARPGGKRWNVDRLIEGHPPLSPGTPALRSTQRQTSLILFQMRDRTLEPACGSPARLMVADSARRFSLPASSSAVSPPLAFVPPAG
jgi:hypothetical protein